MNDGLQKRSHEDIIMTMLYKQAAILFGGVLLVGWFLSLDKQLFAIITLIIVFTLLEYNRRKMESKQESEPVVTS